MASFLLIHGAMGGAWCWEPVLPGLRAAGHEAHAIDLPGQGADTTPLAEITLYRYADAVCDALDGMDGPVVLTGHSMGGMVITQAASQRPEKLAGLVYVAAFLPQPGQALIDITQLARGGRRLGAGQHRGRGRPAGVHDAARGRPRGAVSLLHARADRMGPAAAGQPAGDPVHAAVHASER